jgi:thymidylate synthase
MRSNDAYRGASSDVFSFTFFQEIMANQLKLELGSYSHVVGSYHLYESDDERVQEILENQTDVISSAPFPSMPAGDNWPNIQIVLDLEERIRRGILSIREPDFEKLGLDYYWQQIVRMLTIYCERRHTGHLDWRAVERLHPLYAAAFYNLWGSM